MKASVLFEQGAPLLGVVSVAGRELVDEPECIDNPDVFGKEANRLMIHFTEWSCHRGFSRCNSTSVFYA